METQDDFEKFLSVYPDYKKDHGRCFLPPGAMERVNAELDRQRPSMEEWKKEFANIKLVNVSGNPDRPA